MKLDFRKKSFSQSVNFQADRQCRWQRENQQGTARKPYLIWHGATKCLVCLQTLAPCDLSFDKQIVSKHLRRQLDKCC